MQQAEKNRRYNCLMECASERWRWTVAIKAGQSPEGEDMVQVLSQVKQQRELPKFLFCDNGIEFTSQAMDLWAYQNGMKNGLLASSQADR